MPFERPTLRDIAKAAGVSVNTVSRALNDKPDINAGTRRRVLDLADEMGYIPNSLATNLRQGRTRTIGVILSDSQNPFFMYVLSGIEHVMAGTENHILVANTEEDHEREIKAIDEFLAQRVDGLLIAPTQQSTKKLEQLKQIGIPFLLVGRYFEEFECNYVVSDDETGSASAVEHLISLGHRRILFLNGPAVTSPARQRRRGFTSALYRHGIPIDDNLIKAVGTKTVEGYDAVRRLLQGRLDATATFVFSDYLAIGAIRAFEEHGVKIPQDMSVVGYDDIDEVSNFLPIPLTTVRLPKRELGEQAARALLEIIENPDAEPIQEVLQPKLIKRSSTAGLHVMRAAENEG